MRTTPSVLLAFVGLLSFSSLVAVGCGDDDPATPAGTGGTSAAGAGGSAGSTAAGTGGTESAGAAGSSAGGAAGAAGAAGGGITPKPGPENVATTYNGWDWVPVPGSLCRNYTETGLAISKGNGADADKVLFFVEGGNACFNEASCGVTFHPEGFGVPQFKALADLYAGSGIMNRDDAANPFKDWTYVGIPYCSGDVFAGTKADIKIGEETFVFQGYKNIGLFIDTAKAKIPTFSQVVVAGISAGGFGSAFNFDRFAQAFSPLDITLIDDSGPPMANDYLAPCLQKKFDDLWGMSVNVPADCAGCVAADGSFIEPYISYVLEKRKNLRFGLISSQADQTISSFWSFGANDCANEFPTPYDAKKYEAGLVDLRDRVFTASPNARVFYLEGKQHVWLLPPDKTKTKSLADVKVGTETLADWLTGARDGGDKWKNVSFF